MSRNRLGRGEPGTDLHWSHRGGAGTRRGGGASKRHPHPCKPHITFWCLPADHAPGRCRSPGNGPVWFEHSEETLRRVARREYGGRRGWPGRPWPRHKSPTSLSCGCPPAPASSPLPVPPQSPQPPCFSLCPLSGPACTGLCPPWLCFPCSPTGDQHADSVCVCPLLPPDTDLVQLPFQILSPRGSPWLSKLTL